MHIPTKDAGSGGPYSWGPPRDGDERAGGRWTFDGEEARALFIDRAMVAVREATGHSSIVAAVDHVLDRYLEIEAFAVLAYGGGGAHVVLARGLDPRELSALTKSWRTADAVACWQLGDSDWSLGWLAVYRLSPLRPALDAFDYELVAALRREVAAALETVEEATQRPTVRPASMTRLRTT
jgi:hypothetical protein